MHFNLLRQTAAAYVRVQRLSAAKPLSESEKMNAIKSAGMEPVQYKHVMMLVQTDKTLRHKFNKTCRKRAAMRRLNRATD